MLPNSKVKNLISRHAKLENELSLANIDKKTRIKNIITDVVHALFSILFMYHMCYICRGFVGFLLLLLVNITYAVIRYGLF